ncbi:MAG: hypothetical protein IKJ09_05805 [Bacteroidaceae bacterium]|nr:hypothetical protein [Bacteroidaceae bacterium]
MVRRYMTERQNEQQRLQNRMSRCDHRLISSVFPTVGKIVIKYEVEHRSAFGASRKEHVSTHMPGMIATFLIDCLNRECTSGIFDLKSDIYSMVRESKSILKGEQKCSGSEAPDHMYQSCSGHLMYEIIIEYK